MLMGVLILLGVSIVAVNFYFFREKCGNDICGELEGIQNCPEDCQSYVLHEWGVLLKDSIRTTTLKSAIARAAKPIIYLYSDNDFDLSLSVDFENGEAMEVWPEIPTGKNISWESLKISSDCETTPFPEQRGGMKEIYELGNYVVDDANCITYENVTSKILFYNGKMDFGDIITGYYEDLEDEKQITLRNNLEQDIYDIYVNYREPSIEHYSIIPEDDGIAIARLGVLKIDKLEAGETKTFSMNTDVHNFSNLPVSWINQEKEFKQELIDNGLYIEEANKFMVAWEDTFFGIQYGYLFRNSFNMDYVDGMNIIFILPEEKYDSLFELETSVEPREIERVGVVYSSIEKPLSAGATTGSSGASGSSVESESCGDYDNRIKIYCNPFSSTYDEQLCSVAEGNYEEDDCCNVFE